MVPPTKISTLILPNTPPRRVSTRVHTEGSILANSSIATTTAPKLIPEPPYASSTSTPMRPCSNNCSTMDLSIISFSSISLAFGRTTSRAKRPTDSLSISSVSVRWKIGVGFTSEKCLREVCRAESNPGRKSSEGRRRLLGMAVRRAEVAMFAWW